MRKAMTLSILNCPVCGRIHGSIAHEMAGGVHYSSLIAANTNFKQNPMPATRKRMSASEAMEFTKVRYQKTLEHLV
jgi:hypothetical protein